MYVVSYKNNSQERVYPKSIITKDDAKKIAENLSLDTSNSDIIIESNPLGTGNETYLITYEKNGEILHHGEILSRDDVGKTVNKIEAEPSVTGISMTEFGAARRNSDSIGNIVSWFNEATPNPTSKNISTQIGCNFEEMHEFSERVSLNNLEIIEDGETAAEILANAQKYLHKLANLCKKNDIAFVAEEDRLEALDAICDITVTGVGVATYLKMDAVGAQREVNRSNFSKFDENGKAIRDENQKIIKGPNYSRADLTAFV